MTAGYRLGVDLGTTYTSAAVARGRDAEAVPLGDHGLEIPSVVYLKPGGGYLVGDAAVAREIDQPERVAREFKRRIGDEAPFFLGGVPVSAHALTGALLRSVLELVTERQGTAPRQTVVTCPANWGPYRRELLEHAMQLAGIADAVLCTEPEAAALQFGTSDRVADGQVVGVYDFGGGTFDAALLRRDGDVLTFVGRPEGIERLGGLDFDAALFGLVVGQLRLEDRDPDEPGLTRGLGRLRAECVLAKERLSYDVDTAVRVDIAGAPDVVRVTRSELEEVIAPLVLDTIACLERVIGHAGLTADDLAAVLLVGGSTRVPLVRELLTERLGRPLPPSPQPKLCVALGAALLGAQRAAHAAPAPAPAAADVPAPAAGAARGVEPAPEVSVAPEALAPPREPDTDSAATPASPPAARATTRSGRRRQGYAAAAAVLAVAGGLAGLVPEAPPAGSTRSWDGEEALDAAAAPAATVRGRLTVLDLPFPEDSVEPGDGEALAFRPSTRLLLAGPLEVQYRSETGDWADAEPRRFVRPDGGWGRRLLTVPGILALLGLLYAFAYGETLLRGVRRRRARVRVGEVLGMTGVGAVLGAVVAIAGWMAGGLPTWPGVVGAVGLVAAASGLAVFAVSAKAERTGPG